MAWVKNGVVLYMCSSGMKNKLEDLKQSFNSVFGKENRQIQRLKRVFVEEKPMF
jgi:hypothetical protein